MKSITLLIVLEMLVTSATAQPHKQLKGLIHFGEHLALGAGTEVAVSLIAGRPHGWAAGLASTAVVAAVKEGTDAYSGRDSKNMAAFHALTILAGAVVAARVSQIWMEPGRHSEHLSDFHLRYISCIEDQLGFHPCALVRSGP